MSNSTYEIRASFKGIENVVGGMKRIEQQIRANTAALREQQKISAQTGRVGTQGQRLQEEGSRRRTSQYRVEESALGRTLKTGERYQRFGREMSYVWREQVDSLRKYTDEAMRLARSQAQFKVIGLSPADNERAFQGARKAANEYNLDLAQTVDLVADIQTATGKLDTTLQHLPLAAKFKFAFSTLFGDRFSPEELEDQLQNTFKFLESTGALAKGKEETERRFNAIAQMMAVSAGRVRPSDLMQLAKRGNPAVQGLGVQGLRTVGTMIPEMTGSGVGTALTSVNQVLGGLLSKSAAEEFMRLGVLKPLGFKFTSAGIRSHIKKGAFGGFRDTMIDDPLAGADMLIKAMKSHGIDTTNDNEIRKELLILFQNRTAQRLMSTLTTQRSQILSQRQLMEGAPDIPAMFAKAGETPMGKEERYLNALKNLRMEIGGPLLTALTSAASAALPLIQIAAKHPVITLAAIAIGRLGMATAQTAIALRTSGLVGSLRAVSTEVRGVSTTLQQSEPVIANQSARLGSRIGSALTFALKAAVVGFAIEKTIGGLMDRAEGEIESRKAGFEIQDLEKQKEGLLNKIRSFSGTPTTQNEIVEIDRKIGELKARQGGALRGGEFFGGKEFGIALAQVVRGPMGAMVHGETGHYGLIRSWNDQVTRSQKERREEFKKQYIPELGSSAEASSWLETIRNSGRYSEAQLSALQVLTAEKYPNFMRQLDGNTDALGRSREALTGFASFLRTFGPQPGPGQSPLGGLKYFPPIIPNKASGGFVHREGLANIHAGELIVPADVTKSLSHRMEATLLSKGGGIHIGDINVSVQGNAESGIERKIARAIRREVLEVLREKRLDELSDDRFRDRMLAI